MVLSFNSINLRVGQKSGNRKGANLEKGWSILQNYAYEEPIDPLTVHDTDVPPIVLYWYIMLSYRPCFVFMLPMLMYDMPFITVFVVLLLLVLYNILVME